ncbi:ribosomal protein l11 (apicoplast) [Cystoisospora suis]|uniref:Ribosomal protein l11 n=1 Tax=Cystoisospora suis TaxID=483139 RepID=A0A2C6KZR7_9APIC|nr:ribosomal protein l11 [Cystoisospora suis]
MIKFKFKIIKLILYTETIKFSSLVSSILGPIGINLNLFYQQYNNYIKFKKDIFLPIYVIIYKDKSFKLNFNTVSTSFFFLTKLKNKLSKTNNKKYLIKKFSYLKQIKLFPNTNIKIYKTVNSTLNSFYNLN